ncbi:MAG: ATP-binding cassette domain-containing protein [Microbacterium sp.]
MTMETPLSGPPVAVGAPVLRATGIRKSFGGVVAVEHADLILHAGEIVALVGGNGAGKSTLISLLSGVAQPDAGTFEVRGQHHALRSPGEARELGIETVYQTLALIDTLDIAQNIFLGREQVRGPRVAGWLAERRMRARAEELIRGLGLRRDMRTLVSALSGGQRQAVALARAIEFETKIVILDEPTAALGVQETKATLEVIDRFRSEGLAILLVSHNMDDVFALADRIVVMRQGRTIVDTPTAQTTQREVVGWITGGLDAHE